MLSFATRFDAIILAWYGRFGWSWVSYRKVWNVLWVMLRWSNIMNERDHVARLYSQCHVAGTRWRSPYWKLAVVAGYAMDIDWYRRVNSPGDPEITFTIIVLLTCLLSLGYCQLAITWSNERFTCGSILMSLVCELLSVMRLMILSTKAWSWVLEFNYTAMS